MGEDVRSSSTTTPATTWRRTSGCSAMRCAATARLFGSEAGVEAAWRIVDGVLSTDLPLCESDTGSRGPVEADKLVADAGGWIEPGATCGA